MKYFLPVFMIPFTNFLIRIFFGSNISSPAPPPGNMLSIFDLDESVISLSSYNTASNLNVIKQVSVVRLESEFKNLLLDVYIRPNWAWALWKTVCD
jgi:hypothetical protein